MSIEFSNRVRYHADDRGLESEDKIESGEERLASYLATAAAVVGGSDSNAATNRAAMSYTR
jgi:hypothetical protein